MTGSNRRRRGESGAGLLIFCLVLTAIFMSLLAATTTMLNNQMDRVQDDYHRAQAITAAEAGLGHAHAVVETSKTNLDVSLPYGTRYRVIFTLCSTVGNQRLWSLTSMGWSTDKKTAWTIQQSLLERLPGGLVRPVYGSWTLSEGLILSSACPAVVAPDAGP